MKYHRISWLRLLCIAGGALSLACSSDESRTVERKVIGSDGGNMNVGVASLEVPAGALEEPTELTMEARPSNGASSLAAPPAGAEYRSNVLTLTPHGLQFETDVQVEMDHEPLEDAGASLVVARLDDDSDDTWEAVPAADFEQGVAQFSVSQFSHYAVFEDGVNAFALDEPGNTGSGGAPGTGGAGTGGAGTGGAGTGGVVAMGGATGGDGAGGSVGGGVSQGNLGVYSSGNLEGFPTAYAEGEAVITDFTTTGIPACVSADIPSGESSRLRIEIKLRESIGGAFSVYKPSDYDSSALSIGLTTPGYGGEVLLELLDTSSNPYTYWVSGSETTTMHLISWADFKDSDGNSYSDQPLSLLNVIVPDDTNAYLDQEICVDSIED